MRAVRGRPRAALPLPVHPRQRRALLARLAGPVAPVAAAVDAPWQTPAIPVGIPKTGFPTEQQAHVAASNIAAQVRGEPLKEHKDFGDIKAVCVMDAGNNGVIILADKMLPPRKHSVMIPGPQAHAMKLAFEKYFLWKGRHSYVNLP